MEKVIDLLTTKAKNSEFKAALIRNTFSSTSAWPGYEKEAIRLEILAKECREALAILKPIPADPEENNAKIGGWMKYKVISDTNLEKFNEQLDQATNNGWTPDGNVCVAVCARGHYQKITVYSILMIRAQRLAASIEGAQYPNDIN